MDVILLAREIRLRRVVVAIACWSMSTMERLRIEVELRIERLMDWKMDGGG